MRKIYKVAKEIKDLMYEDVANTIKNKILDQKSLLVQAYRENQQH